MDNTSFHKTQTYSVEKKMKLIHIFNNIINNIPLIDRDDTNETFDNTPTNHCTALSTTRNSVEKKKK